LDASVLLAKSFPWLERTLNSLDKIDDNTANAAISDYTFNFIGAYVAFPHAAGRMGYAPRP
jgi:hypothetical protein